MNKNKILSGGRKNLTGGGKNLTGRGKWGWRGGEVGGEGEGSGVKGGGKWGERGREVGVGYPPVHPPLLYSHAFRLTRNTVYCAIVSDQIVVGCPLGVPISYYQSYSVGILSTLNALLN